MTDIVYMDDCKNEIVKLTANEDHVSINKSVLKHPNVFSKNFAWSYEKECRLIVRLKDNTKDRLKREQRPFIRLSLSQQSLKKMNEKRVIRSPIYKGTIGYGEPSELAQKVEWEL